MMINELIEQISGRERLQEIYADGFLKRGESKLMAHALLAVLDAKPFAYMHQSGQVVTREECCDDKVFSICCKVETPPYTTPPAASVHNTMQPLYIAGDGRIRFKANAIVRHLLTSAGKVGVDLNSIAMDDFSDDDRMQLAQLIGYSLGGYGELSYVSDESYNAAVAAAPAPGGDGG
jgi:hypothetical protein